MAIEIIALRGECRGELIDVGVDIVTDNGREIAIVGRKKNAPIQLIVNGIAPATLKQVRKAVDSRDLESVHDDLKPMAAARFEGREIQEPPIVEDDKGK